MNSKTEGLFVNIGAGLSCGKSWVNFDASPTLLLSGIPVIGKAAASLLRFSDWPAAVRYGDIVTGLPLPEGSCRLIFSSHVFEHLSLNDFEQALANVYKYLEQGGTFRVIVPDLEVYCRKYVRRLDERTDISTASVDFLKAAKIGCEGSRAGLMSRLRESLGNSRHQWLWDRESLMNKLKERGFKNIRLCGHGDWADARFAEVEEASRHADAICLECEK